MTKSTWFAATALGACVTLFACSSTSSGGGDAAVSYGAYTGCIEGEAPQACTSCLENSCGTQLSNFESSCTDYLQCICPGGTYSDTSLVGTGAADDYLWCATIHLSSGAGAGRN